MLFLCNLLIFSPKCGILYMRTWREDTAILNVVRNNRIKVVCVMKTTILCRQVELDDTLRGIIDTKLSKYDRFFREDASATVKLSRLRGRERVEITIRSEGTIFRGEVTDTTFRNALDMAMDAIERQIRKHKTKLEKRLRDGAISDLFPNQDSDVIEADEKIIRTKTFRLKPMLPEEAIMQMELLGHDFFVFADSQTGETNVVYRRHDGDYGMIMPEK